MEIRRLSGADAEVYRCIRLEGLKLNPEAFGSSFEEELDYSVGVYCDRLDSEVAYTYGAFAGATLIGVVTLVQESKRKMHHRANIFGMYVTPGFRGQSAGKELMQAVIRKASELKKIEQIYLAVVSNNVPAKNLYDSLGFKTYGVDHHALRIEDDYFDEDLMVLFL